MSELYFNKQKVTDILNIKIFVVCTKKKEREKESKSLTKMPSKRSLTWSLV